MKVEQIYTGCLAEAAYYIESEGEAVVIDPLRETTPYVTKAEKEGAQIKYVLETHFHADFVSGHLDLAKKTGATIVFGPNANPNYDAHIAQDGEELKVGKLTIKVLHTPGHTLESTTYLLKDENGKDHCIFTGDTLFIGDVGRPDLAVQENITEKDLAAMMYESLRNKIMPLADDVIVYPAHGAGSACGKKMSKETFDTLGNQKKTNYALQDLSKEEFIKQLLDGIMPPPQYFPKNAMLNKSGYESFDEILEKGLNPIKVEEVEALISSTGAMILDTRHQSDFVKAHIPGSIFIGIDGGFAPWVGTLITDLKQPIIIVAPKEREEEVITRLSRVGYDNTLGFIEGGVEAWQKAGKATDSMDSIDADELEKKYKADQSIDILDVRKKSEYESEHVVNAQNTPLDWINEQMDEVDDSKHYYVHCAGGYRSVIAISILKARGLHKFTNIEGGFKAMKEKDFDKTEYVCPSTML